jgi:hypothetical protein
MKAIDEDLDGDNNLKNKHFMALQNTLKSIDLQSKFRCRKNTNCGLTGRDPGHFSEGRYTFGPFLIYLNWKN